MDASRRTTRWSAAVALLFGLLFVPAQGWGQQYSDHSDFLHFNMLEGRRRHRSRKLRCGVLTLVSSGKGFWLALLLIL